MSRSEIHTLIFDSPVQAAQFAADTQRVENSYRQSAKSEDYDWDRGQDLPTVLNNVQTGYIWREGLDAMNTSMDITDELAARSELPRVVRAVAGGVPCVPAAVMGHPKSMYKRTRRPTVDRPVLAIGINTGIAWHIKSHQRLNFAAAMLSAVDVMESNGYRVELTALWRAPASDGTDPLDTWANIEIMLKRAEERWNPSTISYIVGHPAVQRRMFWRILETQEQWRRCTNGYCMHKDTIEYDRSMAQDFDIYFGNMASAQAKACNTPEGAFKYVQKIVNTMLDQHKAAIQ